MFFKSYPQTNLFLLPCLSQEEMTSALATMRVDYDQVKIKDLDTSSNPLLNKRRKKAAAGSKSSSTVCQSQWDARKDEQCWRLWFLQDFNFFIWTRETEWSRECSLISGNCIRTRATVNLKDVSWLNILCCSTIVVSIVFPLQACLFLIIINVLSVSEQGCRYYQIFVNVCVLFSWNVSLIFNFCSNVTGRLTDNNILGGLHDTHIHYKNLESSGSSKQHDMFLKMLMSNLSIFICKKKKTFTEPVCLEFCGFSIDYLRNGWRPLFSQWSHMLRPWVEPCSFEVNSLSSTINLLLIFSKTYYTFQTKHCSVFFLNN